MIGWVMLSRIDVRFPNSNFLALWVDGEMGNWGIGDAPHAKDSGFIRSYARVE